MQLKSSPIKSLELCLVLHLMGAFMMNLRQQFYRCSWGAPLDLSFLVVSVTGKLQIMRLALLLHCYPDADGNFEVSGQRRAMMRLLSSDLISITSKPVSAVKLHPG
ncbi:hypothetical protein F4778DRAFT_753098 [Xylariomycetidae sp. FL2044]|nr:hypothetical protein F4778DRAFT_753098 [Xylariomycetidae sp. FL2044]